MQLDTTAFDVQFFISEYAQDLSPSQSKQLLRLLNTTQRCFLDVQESVTTQVEHLEAQLQLEQDLDHQKVCLSLWILCFQFFSVKPVMSIPRDYGVIGKIFLERPLMDRV